MNNSARTGFMPLWLSLGHKVCLFIISGNREAELMTRTREKETEENRTQEAKERERRAEK